VAFLIGTALALFAALVLGTAVGMDRDRAYYPVVTIVVASYYSLYAVIGGSTRALVIETLVGLLFLAAAVVGFRSSLWLTMAALAGHGVFDLGHGALIDNPGVPRFWPDFCLGFDVTAGAYLAWLLKRGRIHAAVRPFR